MTKAAFAAGCFWGVEESFRLLKGVKSTAVGYMGGKTKNPSYKEVCSGETGYAETVLLEYNSKIISYEKLIDVFWNIHNPTTKNRQGLDIGSQYRSIIFYFTEEQKKTAEKSKRKLNDSGKYWKPIITEIIRAPEFYKAEDYHQKYLMKKGLKVC
ncbi:peptide-methionine (S)-S-oxide reductase MsrA [Candidatus Woesearchaeota archaeon]|nr:peptide-methionine (S)-S-oxide reductase MsrA [Candidatus Woesearchaeota archaeon]